MSQTAQVLHLVSSIELPDHTLVANSAITSLIQEIDLLKKQEKALKTSIDKKIAEAKAYMGNAECLVTKDGIELATWKYNKDMERVDSKRLAERYPEVYNQVVELVSGSRVFLIK